MQNLSQLRAIDLDPRGHYVLGNDIAGQGNFLALASDYRDFSGVFDGLGHTISNLNIYGTGPAVGMFSNISGAVRNLKLDRATVNGSRTQNGTQLGVLAGINSGDISNVHVTNSTVIGSHNSHVIGGLVGNFLWGSINNTSFSGKVEGNANSIAIGGLIGILDNKTRYAQHISNSSANAYISGSGRRDGVAVGGLVGRNVGGNLQNVQSTGTISVQYANASVGGLIGLNALSFGTYDLSGTVNDASSAVHVSSAGAGSNVGGLIGTNISGKLTNVQARGDVNGQGSNAIGGLIGLNKGSSTFLTIRVEDARYEGQIKDLKAAQLGGLVGLSENARLYNVRAKAKVIGGDQTNIGGIVGKAYDSSVVLADATVDLSGGIHSNIGGIVGDADNSQFKDLNVRGKLSVRESGDYGTSWVGGIAGFIYDGYVAYAKADVDIQARAQTMAGGIVGMNVGNIYNVSASGSITGGDYVAGLVGQNFRWIRDATTSVQIKQPRGLHALLIASDQNHSELFQSTLRSTSTQNGLIPLFGITQAAAC